MKLYYKRILITFTRISQNKFHIKLSIEDVIINAEGALIFDCGIYLDTPFNIMYNLRPSYLSKDVCQDEYR